MVTPCIHHLCQVAVIKPDPTVKNSGHYFKQEDDNYLRMTEARQSEKPDFCNQPCKKYQVSSKKNILQAIVILSLQNRYYYSEKPTCNILPVMVQSVTLCL